MTSRRFVALGALFLTSSLVWLTRHAHAERENDQIVRLAELEIDPAQLETYKALLREEIRTSIRVEPGVLTLYAVSVKGHPEQIHLFEVYANAAAYEAHVHSPHFIKYKTETQAMVRSLQLRETVPVLLGSKGR